LEYHIYSIVSRGLWSFFSTISCGLYSRATYIFLFLYLIERYRWRSVFPWLRFVYQTLFSYSILFSITCASVTAGIMMNRRQLQWCKHHYQGYQLNAKRVSTRMYLRGLGNLCSSAAYINF